MVIHIMNLVFLLSICNIENNITTQQNFVKKKQTTRLHRFNRLTKGTKEIEKIRKIENAKVDEVSKITDEHIKVGGNLEKCKILVRV